MKFTSPPPPDDAPLLEWAMWYVTQGWSVLPCHGKVPIKPAVPHGLRNATRDEAQVRSWWAQWPQANIGITVDAWQVVLDVDPRSGGDTTLHDLKQRYGPLPDTLTSHTGGGGLHLFFLGRGPVKNKARIGDGIDVQAVGSYVIVPPSVHPATGNLYLWDLSYGPDAMEPQPLPLWLEKLVTIPEASGTSAARALDPGTPIPKGQRERTLMALAGAMQRIGASPDAIRSALETENARCLPPLEAADLDRMTRSVGRYAPAPRLQVQPSQPSQPSQDGETGTAPARSDPDHGMPLSDYFNALALVERYGPDMHYCYPWKSWIVWTGTHWQRDERGTMKQWAKETMRGMLDTLKDIADAKARDALYKHIKASLSTGRLEGMVHEAQDERPVMPEHFDQHLWLLNCLNGTMDLRTGILQPHSRDDMLMKCLDIPYDPKATCPTWERFLWRIMGGSVEPDDPDGSTAQHEARYEADERARRLTGFIQRAVGYSLTGITREDCFFILWGKGRNGKSTFLETIKAMSGPYAETAEISTFLARKDEAVRDDIADLHGARFVSTSEVEKNRRLSEGLIKHLTGNEAIKARFLFEKHFTFKPQMHIWMATNNKPVIRGTDMAIWKRPRLIPFEVVFEENQPHAPTEKTLKADKDLGDKLRAELPGILAWAVKGCLEWQRYSSLKEPPEVIAATQAYRHEMDTLVQFIEECCLISPEVRIKAGVFYKAYQQWCLDHGHQADSMTEIGKRIEDLNGVTKKKINVYWYKGIGIYVENEEDTRDTRDTRDTF